MTDKKFLPNSISITSVTGVGSSTTVKRLMPLLPHITRLVSGGGIQRGLAASRGMTIEQWSEYCRNHLEEGIDQKVEAMLAAYGKQNHVVIESRLAHIAAPHSFHVLLHCDADIRASRRSEQERRDFEDVRAAIIKRDEDDETRYKALYGDDVVWGHEKFDLVIDTGNEGNSPDRIAAIIVEEHAAWAQRNKDVLHDEWVVSL